MNKAKFQNSKQKKSSKLLILNSLCGGIES